MTGAASRGHSALVPQKLEHRVTVFMTQQIHMDLYSALNRDEVQTCYYTETLNTRPSVREADTKATQHVAPRA